MSTLWFTRMCAYKHTREARMSAEYIVRYKVERQFRCIVRRVPAIPRLDTYSQILLFEARSARTYWREYRKLVPLWAAFATRKAQGKDVVNTLLDIGYHHLNSTISNILKRHNVPPALALLHTAKTEKSKPLVYDLMELFRADLVDREVLRYVRLKKKPVAHIEGKEIGKFLSHLNTRMERKVYLKEFKQCHAYRYAMELQVLRFIHAVNHGEVFHPLVVPARHESRCS